MKAYKYYSVSGYNLAALANRQFWASKPSNFNDPFDTPFPWLKIPVTTYKHLVIKNGPDITSVEKIAERNLEEKEVNRLTNCGLICFSKSKDNLLMWSHYADEHRGYVLEFEIDEAKLDSGMARRFITIDYSESIDISARNPIPSIVKYKSKCWSYEEELRYILNVGDTLHDWSRIEAIKSLTSVIFGCRTESSNKKAIINIVNSNNSNIEFYEANLSKDIFKLNINRMKLN